MCPYPQIAKLREKRVAADHIAVHGETERARDVVHGLRADHPDLTIARVLSEWPFWRPLVRERIVTTLSEAGLRP